MIDLHTSELWATAEVVALAEGVTARSVRARFQRLLASTNGSRHLYERLLRSERGGGLCGARKEFNVAAIARNFPSAISPEALAALGQRHTPPAGQIFVTASSSILERPAEQQSLALTTLPERLARKISHVPPAARDQVAARYAAIELLVPDEHGRERWVGWTGKTVAGVAITKKDDFVHALVADWKRQTSGGPVELVDFRALPARLSSLSPRLLWLWQAYYRKGRRTRGGQELPPGPAALADPPRRDAGASRIFGAPPASLPADAEGIERELARLTPAGRRIAQLAYPINGRGYSFKMCWEVLKREHHKLGLESPPSPRSVAAFLSAFPSPLRDRARLSAKQFNDGHAPYVLRDYSSVRVMEWFEFDHAQDDFFVYNGYLEAFDRFVFADHPRNAWLRMWLTACRDIRSRKVLGYAFSVNPSSGSICSALRMALLRTGRPPRVALVDRGKDFIKVTKPGPALDAEAAGALTRLIRDVWGNDGQIIRAIGRHPQSKPVESWFKTKRVRFDQLVPSYAGHRPDARPDSCQELLRQHEEWQAGKRETTPLPHAFDAIAATAYWIERSYNLEHPHNGRGMGGRTPEQVFRAGYPEQQEREARAQLDRRKLDVFLWDRSKRRVFHSGCVRLYSTEYEPADAESLAILRAWDGKDLLVAADPNDPTDAVAIDPATGATLGVLHPKRALDWGADRNAICAEMRHQRGAAKHAQQFLAALGGTTSDTENPFAFLGFSPTGTDPARGAALPLPEAPAKRLAAQAARSERTAEISPFVDDAVARLRERFRQGGE